jgi:hypothetical protein
VCIDAPAERANVRAAQHIQHRRSNGWADRGPNWYKHLLGQWAEVMGVGDRECALMRDRECALMRAQNAQTCAQHHISIIGGQTAGSIAAQIGTNTNFGQWEEVMEVGDSECALMRPQSAQTCAQHHTYSIGGQTAGPIGAHICTNTYWDNGQKLWGSSIASAH